MNDQQSPSAPDPQVPPPLPPKPLIRSRRESALSDQEAFALLAESMAEGHDRSGSIEFESPREAAVTSKVRPLEWRPADLRSRDLVRARNDGPIRGDMPPVVPFRIAPPEFEGQAGDATRSLTERVVSGRHRFDWSTPVLVDEQWEVVDLPAADPIHGHITEVIDLSQVPPMAISTEPDDVIAAIDQETASSDHLMEAPAISDDRPDSTNRIIMPPIEESNDVESLPPLVFLNTRGDILPRVGEKPNSGNGDTFDGEAAARDGGEPPVATTTSAGGVENMAEPRGDFEAAADFGLSVDRPNAGKSGLTNAGDTENPQPLATSHAPVPVDPGPFYAATVTPTTNGAAADSRLEELQDIFDQYSGPVIAVIASIAGDRRAIDEALQSTFEAVWKTVDTFDADQPRGPWMFTLARRQAAEQVELARRLEQESTPGRYPVPSHRQDAAATVDKSWEAWEVRLAVDQLTRSEHDVLRLIHNEGLIHAEIAAQLHTTVGAVKSHAYSGSHRLVELLDHVIRPDATDTLTVDQASALTWYLAGVADGSDLGTAERSAVKRVQGQLASATAWITPDTHARERVISYARRTLDDPGPVSGSDRHGHGYAGTDGPVEPLEAARPEVTGRHQVIAEPDKPNSRPWLIVGLSAVGLIALVAAFSLRSGSTEAEPETIRRYQLQASGLDADAAGFVEITTVSTGSRYQLELGGLDPSTDEFFYAAWLQSTAGGGVVPLGTFSWRADGDPLTLSGPAWSDAYDLLVITRSATMTRASIDDPPVLSVSIE